MKSYVEYKGRVHRLVPSKFPPVSLFDWVTSAEELEQIALLEGLTNDRILSELGTLNLIDKEDWIGGPGSTPLMAAFTHIGFNSRFSDGSFGIYYAASTLATAIKETSFHRARFYSASMEKPCTISMREYISCIKKPLIDLHSKSFQELFNPDPLSYRTSQEFGKEMFEQKEWGLLYPSVRDNKGSCVAVLRPPALAIPIQGCHLRYFWDGEKISEVYTQDLSKC